MALTDTTPLSLALELAAMFRKAAYKAEESMTLTQGLTPTEQAIISAIYNTEDAHKGVLQTEITEAIGVNADKTSLTVKALVKKGLVTKEKFEFNTNTNLIRLTETGQVIAENAAPYTAKNSEARALAKIFRTAAIIIEKEALKTPEISDVGRTRGLLKLRMMCKWEKVQTPRTADRFHIYLNSDKGDTIRAVDDLEKKGFVNRAPQKGRDPSRELSLTGAGEELRARVNSRTIDLSENNIGSSNIEAINLSHRNLKDLGLG